MAIIDELQKEEPINASTKCEKNKSLKSAVRVLPDALLLSMRR